MAETSVSPSLAPDASLERDASAGRAELVLSAIDRVFGGVALCLMLALVGIVFSGVIARYVFNASFPWTEELASWTFIWLIFTGVALGHRGERHVTIGMLETGSNPTASGTLRRFLVDAIVAYATVALLFGGMKIVHVMTGTSTGLQWPNYIKYLIIPLSSVVSLVYLVLARFGDARRFFAALLAIATGAAVYWATTVAGFTLFEGASPSLVMTIAFSIAIAVGVPIGFAMLFSVFVASWGSDLMPVPAAVQSVVVLSGQFVLLAVPFFLAAGYLMNSGGLSARIIDLASALVGHWRGGLAQANVLHSVLLGGICGSSGADAASTTKILVPEMIKRGYSGPFSCAVTAVGSILPACFPPSIALLVYASIAEVSVAQLFTAGIVPGLVLAVFMMATVYIVSVRRNYEVAGKRATLWEMGRAVWRALPASMLAILILGLLRFGVATATEVGVVAVLWCFFIGKFVYRAFSWRQFFRDMTDAAVDSALIGFLIGVSGPFAWVIIAEQVPQLLVHWTSAYFSGKFELLILINIVMLLAGTFLEVIPCMLIVVPLFTPVMIAAGVDPIHLGVVITINLLLGSLTPPVGILVFIAASIAKVSAKDVFRECNPFLLACVVGLALITYIPALSLTLWKLIGL